MAELSLYANNNTVNEFAKLVYAKAGKEYKYTPDSPHYFDRELYNTALCLPECESLSFKMGYDPKKKFGKFIGNKIYNNINDKHEKTIPRFLKNNPLGWIQDINDVYYLVYFTPYNSYEWAATRIILREDFIPAPIVEDFAPLYDVLRGAVKLSNQSKSSTNTANPYVNVVEQDSIKNDPNYGAQMKVTCTAAAENALNDLKPQASQAMSSAIETEKYMWTTLAVNGATGKSADQTNNQITSMMKGQGMQIIDNLADTATDLVANEIKAIGAALPPPCNVLFDGLSEYAQLLRDYLEFLAKEPWKDGIYDLFPNQVAQGGDAAAINSSDNYIQAVIYSINPNGYSGSELVANGGDVSRSSGDKSSSSTGLDLSLNSSVEMLKCYQQPESISYSVDSAYETVSPRGSQTPYQFYQNTNQIALSFELKWHIDEVRTMVREPGKSANFEFITSIAESLARPWAKDNGSIQPKVCRVILPSLAETGYITNVSISYSGGMTGDFSDGSVSAGVLTDTAEDGGAILGKNYSSTKSNDNEFHSAVTYTYSELTISFTMNVIRDVKLADPTNPLSVRKLDMDNTSRRTRADEEKKKKEQMENEFKQRAIQIGMGAVFNTLGALAGGALGGLM